MHRGRKCPRIRAQFLSVGVIVPWFAPMKIAGTVYFSTLGVETFVDLRAGDDAVWDIDDLTATWRGPFRWLATDGTYVLGMGYDATIGYNAYVLELTFSNGAVCQVRMDPTRPYQWNQPFPVTVMGYTVIHLPVMFSDFHGMDLHPVPYY